MEKAYGASLYISYARADEERLGVVAQLYKAYQATWVNLKVDKNVVKPRESFKDFIEELGKADSIIVLFSDAYFKSFYCMLELTRIIETGNAKERVFPVFLEDCRLDDKQRGLKKHWEEKLTNWQAPYEESECIKEEYGSEDECQCIVDSYDDIFDCFAHDQAYDLVALSEDSFKKNIKWSKGRYLQACKNNPILEEAIKHLKNSDDSVKAELKTQIIENIIDEEIADGDIIPLLVQNHPADLLGIISTVQSKVNSLSSKHSLSRLIKLLLPLLFDPSYVSNFKAKRDSIDVITITYATPLSAEVLMASSDSRALDLYVKKVSEVSDLYESQPGKYLLALPPEGGESEEIQLEYTAQHLENLTGDDKPPNILLMQNKLFEDHVPMKNIGKDYPEGLKEKQINKNLERIKVHYYWIMPLNEDEAWANFAKKLAKRYPKIIVLQLDDNDDKEVDEADLFFPLHQIISH